MVQGKSTDSSDMDCNKTTFKLLHIHSMDYTHIPSTTKKVINHTADPSTW